MKKLKKIVIALLVISCISVTLLSCKNNKSTVITDDNGIVIAGDNVQATEELEFEKNANGTGYMLVGIKKNTLTEIVVPSVYKDLPVEKINKGVFSQCANVISITLPFVGGTPYYNAESSHFSYVFGAAYEYEGEQYVPKSLKTIVITGGSGGIISKAFTGCGNVTNISLPKNISVAPAVLKGCDSLETLTIGVYSVKTTSSSGSATGSYNETRMSILFGEEIQRFDSGTKTPTVPETLKKLILIGDGTIGNNAFRDYINLETVEIKGSVTTIETYAFLQCNKITNVVFPESLNIIEEGAFSGCTSLKNITLPGRISTVGGFRDCTSLESIVIPKSVQTIGFSAFEGCTGLKSVTIPDSVTRIEGRAFGSVNLTSITYEGTKNEWENIHKRSTDGKNNHLVYDWNGDYSKITQIYCSDGVINLEN